jgi:hypothetical protein
MIYVIDAVANEIDVVLKMFDLGMKIQDFIERGISYDFDQKNYIFWELVNSFKMMK